MKLLKDIHPFAEKIAALEKYMRDNGIEVSTPTFLVISSSGISCRVYDSETGSKGYVLPRQFEGERLGLIE